MRTASLAARMLPVDFTGFVGGRHDRLLGGGLEAGHAQLCARLWILSVTLERLNEQPSVKPKRERHQHQVRTVPALNLLEPDSQGSCKVGMNGVRALQDIGS